MSDLKLATEAKLSIRQLKTSWKPDVNSFLWKVLSIHYI